MAHFDVLLNFLFPRRCVGCGRLGGYFCDRCRKQIVFITHPICPMCGLKALGGVTHPKCRTLYSLDGLYAASKYFGPVKQAVHLIKYRLVKDLVQFTVDELFETLQFPLPSFDYMVPVPLHKKRHRYRGFNQCDLMAKLLSEKLHTQLLNGALLRVQDTKPQADLKREDRLKNMRHAFTCLDSSIIQGKTIALVDDVATTCATLRECANVLKRAGAKKVWGIVLAHG